MRSNLMTQEMTSFVLRFVREVSEDQEARWRGLIQHVQSGTERNFATFADAVQFMQGHVLENTIQALDEGAQVAEKNPFTGMAKMWGEFGPQMAEMWSQTIERVMDQSAVFRSQVDRAVSATLKAWGMPSGASQDEINAGLARLGEKIERLSARVEAFEQQAASKRSGTGERESGLADQ
jgi:hypothetical protein